MTVCGHAFCQAALFNRGTFEVIVRHPPASTLFPYTTLFRSSLVPSTQIDFGSWKVDGTGNSVEFAAGGFANVQTGGSNGGGLLFSGATVTMTPFGSFNSELDVEGGSLSMLGASATGHNLTLGGGGTYKGAGSLSVNDFHWNGGTLGDGGGTLTVTGTTTIAGSADKFLAAPYQLNLEGSGSWFGSGNLHALAP